MPCSRAPAPWERWRLVPTEVREPPLGYQPSLGLRASEVMRLSGASDLGECPVSQERDASWEDSGTGRAVTHVCLSVRLSRHLQKTKFTFLRCAILLKWEFRKELFSKLAWGQGLGAEYDIFICMVRGGAGSWGDGHRPCAFGAL